MTYERTLVLSLGRRSTELLAKAIGRLDSDEVKEAKQLGLTEALGSFLKEAPFDKALCDEARLFGEAVEELWQKTNMRWSHPLDLKNVWKSLSGALKHYKNHEEREGCDPPLYGIASAGQYDEMTSLHVLVHAVAFGVEPDAKVVVGIKRGRGMIAEACCFWPELNMTTNLWVDYAPKLKTWGDTKADDRIATTRAVAECLVALLEPDAFQKKAKTKG